MFCASGSNYLQKNLLPKLGARLAVTITSEHIAF
jgi:hypothetical protein